MGGVSLKDALGNTSKGLFVGAVFFLPVENCTSEAALKKSHLRVVQQLIYEINFPIHLLQTLKCNPKIFKADW